MFYIYGMLIIVIINMHTISSHIENSTWYHSGTGFNSLTGEPGKIREIAWHGPPSEGVTKYICIAR
jgi:hypothetical protein